MVVTPEAPDPFGNAAARWFYALAKGLVGRGHQVSFASAYSPATGPNSLRRARDFFSALGLSLQLYPYPMRPWMARKWRTLTRPYSFFLSEDLERDLHKTLRKGYDILNLEQMWTGYLGVGVQRALLTVHHLELLDLNRVVLPSLGFLISKHLMQKAERHILAASTDVRVTTDRLNREVVKLNPRARVFTAPVAIDPDLYEWAFSDHGSRTVGLIASLNWSPGYNAAVRLLTRIWPMVKRAVSDASLLIVGWGARQALSRYLPGSGVTVVENVPSTKDYFRRLAVLVYPLSQGSGMKIKLLEAMAYGTPIVTTSEGAEGLSKMDASHAFVSDEDEEIVAATVRLLRDRERSLQLSRAARALVENHYSPAPVVTQMERIYDDVMCRSGQRL